MHMAPTRCDVDGGSGFGEGGNAYGQRLVPPRLGGQSAEFDVLGDGSWRSAASGGRWRSYIGIQNVKYTRNNAWVHLIPTRCNGDSWRWKANRFSCSRSGRRSAGRNQVVKVEVKG